MSSAWYPFYWSDYSGKTMHLTMVEHGAYMLLLRWVYTKNQPIPHEKRYVICSAVSKKERGHVDSILAEFFVKNEDGWVNKRALEVIQDTENKKEKKACAGRLGGQKKSSNARNLLEQKPSNDLLTTTTTTTIEEKENFAKEKHEKETDHAQADQRISPSHHQPDAGANPVTATAKPQPTYAGPEQLAGYQLAAANPQAVIDFEALFAIWPAKKKKLQARQAYTIARNRGVAHETMTAGARRFAKYHAEQKTKEQFLQPLDDWINSDGWTATNGKPANKKPQV